MPVPTACDSTSDVARPRAALGEHPVGVDDALHGEAEDRLLGADRVPAGDGAAGLGHHFGRRARMAAMASRGSARGRRRR